MTTSSGNLGVLSVLEVSGLGGGGDVSVASSGMVVVVIATSATITGGVVDAGGVGGGSVVVGGESVVSLFVEAESGSGGVVCGGSESVGVGRDSLDEGDDDDRDNDGDNGCGDDDDDDDSGSVVKESVVFSKSVPSSVEVWTLSVVTGVAGNCVEVDKFAAGLESLELWSKIS